MLNHAPSDEAEHKAAEHKTTDQRKGAPAPSEGGRGKGGVVMHVDLTPGRGSWAYQEAALLDVEHKRLCRLGHVDRNMVLTLDWSASADVHVVAGE